MNQSVSLFVALLCLTLLCIVNVQPVKAEAAVYIRADGTIKGTDKIQRDGNVYTFTEDVSIDVLALMASHWRETTLWLTEQATDLKGSQKELE